jgi:molecular chaperone GrpE
VADRETQESETDVHAVIPEVAIPIATEAETIPREPLRDLDTERVLAGIDRIGAQLQELANTVRGRLVYDEAKEQAFDRLYAELDALKKGAALDYIRPLLLDMILVYDRMEQARQQAAAGQGVVSAETLQSFIDELLEVLFRRDVSLIECTSASFDYNQQKAIGIVDVPDPGEHQKVDRVVRRGFRLVDRILRPEEVIVRRLVTPQPSAPSPTTDGRDESKEESL